MRAIGTKCLHCSVLFWLFCSNPFFYFTFTLPSLLSRSNYELYTVCCSVAERAPFPHRWIFWGTGNWMLLSCFVLGFFFFFQRWWGRKLGKITPNDPIEAFYLKPRRCIYQSSTLMNYVRGWETTPLQQEQTSSEGGERQRDRE